MNKLFDAASDELQARRGITLDEARNAASAAYEDVNQRQGWRQGQPTTLSGNAAAPYRYTYDPELVELAIKLAPILGISPAGLLLHTQAPPSFAVAPLRKQQYAQGLR